MCVLVNVGQCGPFMMSIPQRGCISLALNSGHILQALAIMGNELDAHHRDDWYFYMKINVYRCLRFRKIPENSTKITAFAQTIITIIREVNSQRKINRGKFGEQCQIISA